MDITREKYEYALNRIEELLPRMEMGELTTSEDIELAIMSDIVEAYEEEHYALEPLPAENREVIKCIWFEGGRIYMRSESGSVYSRPLEAFI